MNFLNNLHDKITLDNQVIIKRFYDKYQELDECNPDPQTMDKADHIIKYMKSHCGFNIKKSKKYYNGNTFFLENNPFSVLIEGTEMALPFMRHPNFLFEKKYCSLVIEAYKKDIFCLNIEIKDPLDEKYPIGLEYSVHEHKYTSSTNNDYYNSIANDLKYLFENIEHYNREMFHDYFMLNHDNIPTHVNDVLDILFYIKSDIAFESDLTIKKKQGMLSYLKIF